MLAVMLAEFGPPSVLVPTELPDPVPGPGQVVVEAAFANITFVETQIRAGRPPNPAMAPALPAVLGNGVGGIVSAVGEGADAALAGTRVVTSTGGRGGYAQRCAVPASRGRAQPAITLGAAALLGPPRPAARDSFIRGLTDGYGIPAETAERVPITGNVSQATDRLAEYADAGVSHLVVGLVGEDWPAQCDLLAQARAALPA